MNNRFEYDYKTLLFNTLTTGKLEPNRTGVDTHVLPLQNLNIDLNNGFPIVTSKKIFFDKAYHEYVWFRDGMTTTSYLNENGIKWWNQYADAKGDLGKTYGYQLRSFNGHCDQLSHVINLIKMGSRRAHITLWNPEEADAINLPPCYTGFTFVKVGPRLHMSMQFRSSDLFLGLPYDICVGALLLIEVAQFCELFPGTLGLNLANAHVYKNHKKQILKYLDNDVYNLPKYNYNATKPEDKLIDYKHGEYISAPLNN